MPKYTGDAFVRYNFRERLIAQLECNYRSATSGDIMQLDGESSGERYAVPPIFDVDLNVNFLINKYISVFGKIGNLFNQRNEYMPLYVEPGRNYGLGVSLTF